MRKLIEKLRNVLEEYETKEKLRITQMTIFKDGKHIEIRPVVTESGK